MKTAFIAMAVVAFSAYGCGKSDNLVGTVGASELGSSPQTSEVNFAGVYDLVRNDSQDYNCGASIRITAECNGYRLFSNHTNQAEEFCDITRNPVPPNRNPDPPNRNPDPPSRNPPPPSRNPPPPSNKQVILSGNILKSVVEVPPYSFSTTLLLQNDTLQKVSKLKSRTSECIYIKR